MRTQDRVLALLVDADDWRSGEWIARKLGVSRTSVWKAIEALRASGLRIEAAQNRGYRLLEGPEPLNEARIRSLLLSDARIGTIELHDEIDSTNVRAKALAAAGAPEGTLVLADRQTGGHGRFGRPFWSPAGGGLYFSLILRPRVPARDAVLLTAMTAVATAEAAQALTHLNVQIKWVNDLYVGPRKVCGILCEAGLDFETGTPEYVVAGVGINTGRMAFPEALRGIATSLGNETGSDVSRNALLAGCLNRLERWLQKGDRKALIDAYRARSNVLGRRVRVSQGNSTYSAVAEAIDDDGALVLRTEGGLRTLSSGEISVHLEEGS